MPERRSARELGLTPRCVKVLVGFGESFWRYGKAILQLHLNVSRPIPEVALCLVVCNFAHRRSAERATVGVASEVASALWQKQDTEAEFTARPPRIGRASSGGVLTSAQALIYVLCTPACWLAPAPILAAL